MDAVFVELAPFRRYRAAYLDDHAYRLLQQCLMRRPEAGAHMRGTGGRQFWLFTLYDKDEASDLTTEQRTALKRMLHAEIGARRGDP